jgi:hypothetical protein
MLRRARTCHYGNAILYLFVKCAAIEITAFENVNGLACATRGDSAPLWLGSGDQNGI